MTLEKLDSRHHTVDKSALAQGLWKSKRTVRCLACSKDLDGSQNVSNVHNHFSTRTHMDNKRAMEAASSSSGLTDWVTTGDEAADVNFTAVKKLRAAHMMAFMTVAPKVNLGFVYRRR